MLINVSGTFWKDDSINFLMKIAIFLFQLLRFQNIFSDISNIGI